MNDGVIHPIIFQQNGKEVARFSSIFQSLQLTERFASGDGITSYNLNTFVTHLGIGTGYNNKYLGDDGHSYLGPKKLGLIRGDIKLGSQTEYSVIMDGKSSIEYLTLGTGSKGYQSASIPGAHAALNFWEGSDGVHYVKGVAISPRYIYFVDGTEDQYLNFVRCKPDLTTGSMKCVKSNEAEFNFDVGYDESLKSTTTQRANLFKFSSNTVDSVKSNLYTP
ncbi:hypothetical protein COU57_06215 [Candidatus Pacearchaeota archaeon CG10_big_fil_rev_8_21_14_0_10_32_14]|nr:MAG: hypothetical protein COU57_06215 [Candidatus Pacearchaeota archaeon CG10_big_fil_rev_8_21_14_0_10_32_14]